jgi:ubiquitin carboxyl-terminal hydrolase 5/13
MCDLKENLWLCLECGNLGCGRAQFGGVGGNSHGLAHSDQTSHGVAVKLGSITPEGTADVYCYKCNEERIDTELAAHLAHWGINIAEREKTEKSLTEMQIEQNLKWDFSMTTEDGKELQPIFGKGFTGLKNIGNTCYLASTLQCLFSLPDFKSRYDMGNTEPPMTGSPAEDLETQLRKVADGLLSGRYSVPDKDVASSDSDIHYQKGLAPAMLKHLIGRGHEEFSTMRQQDSFELLLHLFKLINLSQHPVPLEDPVKSFRFVMEQRLQCLNCKRVRYRTDEQDNISVPVPVRRLKVDKIEGEEAQKGAEFESIPLKECLDIFTGEEVVELTCPACNSKAGFSKRSLFKTFPQNLVVNAIRFKHVNWVPTKLDVPVKVIDEVFDMSMYKSHGLQPDEETLPDDAGEAQNRFVPNEGGMSMLEGMGFSRVRAEKALHATGNQDPKAAMNWVFAHMDEPDIDIPISLPGTSVTGKAGNVDPAKVSMMAEMGITAPQARKALKETGGDVVRAVDWVFSHPDDTGEMLVGSEELPANFQLQSIVCHKGASIHAGYVFPSFRICSWAKGDIDTTSPSSENTSLMSR